MHCFILISLESKCRTTWNFQLLFLWKKYRSRNVCATSLKFKKQYKNNFDRLNCWSNVGKKYLPHPESMSSWLFCSNPSLQNCNYNRKTRCQLCPSIYRSHIVSSWFGAKSVFCIWRRKLFFVHSCFCHMIDCKRSGRLYGNKDAQGRTGTHRDAQRWSQSFQIVVRSMGRLPTIETIIWKPGSTHFISHQMIIL